MKNFGFTLAEVLITLGIIGIIAVVTIPNLMAQVGKQQTVELFKKGYLTINNAFLEMELAKGCKNDLVCTGLFKHVDGSTETPALGNELLKYIKTSKVCGVSVVSDSSVADCWPVNVNENYDGSSASNYKFNTDSTVYKFISEDGMSFAILNEAYSSYENCSHLTSGYDGKTYAECGYLFFDINGLKGPNYLGKDVFVFNIVNDPTGPLIARGSRQQTWWNSSGGDYCGTNSYKGGDYCTGRIIEKGWKIDYY